MKTDTSPTPNYSLSNTILQLETVRSCKFALPFERIVRHRRMNRGTTQTNLIINVHSAHQSLKHVLIMCSSSTEKKGEETLVVFNTTKVDITLKKVMSTLVGLNTTSALNTATRTKGSFENLFTRYVSRHFFEEAYLIECIKKNFFFNIKL